MKKPLLFLIVASFFLQLTACYTPAPASKRDGSKPPHMPKEDSQVVEVSEAEVMSTASSAAPPPPKAEMTRIEQEMLDEINLMRSDPPAYIPYIQDYLEYYEREGFADVGQEEATARELITQLQQLRSLPPLQSHEELYQLARRHGEDLRKKGSLWGNPHTGIDGSSFDDRLKRDTRIHQGAENIGSYHPSVRYLLASLLVDAGVPGRGHRLNLLDRRWKLIGCYFVGQVGQDPNAWVMDFGDKEKAATASVDVSEETKEATQNEVAAAGYMSAEEQEMINEINLLRGSPKDYIPFIEQYIQDVKDGKIWTMVSESEEIATAKGLIEELRQMQPLQLLRPHPKLYNVARNHGQDLQHMGNIDQRNPHQGSDGSQPGDRIRQGAGLSVGGENFASNRDGVRATVIDLLVDSGIPGFGHRKALLDPAWEYVACYKVGKIAASGGLSMPNCWVQNFGKE